jgi:cell division protein ZapA
MEASAGYGRLPQDTKSLLLALNIADDYFKAKDMVEAMEEDIENKDQSAYNTKHDLVSAQMEIARLKKELAKAKR